MHGLIQKCLVEREKAERHVFPLRQAPKAVLQNGARIEVKTAEDATQWLLSQKFISTVPLDDVGAYLRFSVTFLAKDESDENRVLTEMARRLSDAKFEF